MNDFVGIPKKPHMKRKGYLFLWGIFGLKIKMACELSAKINLLITGCIHPIFNGCTTTTACRGGQYIYPDRGRRFSWL